MSDLVSAFNKYFEIVPVNSPDLQQEFFHLRYQVYSEELRLSGFESWRFPDGFETDEYDQPNRSASSLLRHRPTGSLVGGIRLVFCDPDNPSKPFPIEAHIGHYFDPALIDPAQLPRRTTAEITRLMLAKQFRSRGRERLYAHGMDSSSFQERPDNRREFPHPVLGLFVALVHLSSCYGITHWYAMMELALDRHLRRYAAHLKPIGSPVDYCGVRRPHFDTADHVLTQMFRKHRDIWDLVTDHGKVWPAPEGERLRHEKPGTKI